MITASWTATAYGADHAATVVQREHDSGWFDIARITTEATDTFDDHEHRWGIAENYRVLTEFDDGTRSAPSTADTATATGTGFRITSNIDPTVNQAIVLRRQAQITLPERVSVSTPIGSYGHRLYRSTDQLGEVFDVAISLTGGEFADLWRPLVAKLRADLPYLCLTDEHGHRWFVGALPTAVNPLECTVAELAAQLVEVSDTPAVVAL